MKATIFTLIFSIVFFVSNAQKYFQCFTNDKNKSQGLSVCYENGKVSYVKYKGQDETIPLTFVKSKAISITTYPTDEDTYAEKYRGKVTGTYKITKSGNWYYVIYVRKKDNKKFSYTIDNDLSVIDGEYRKTPCY